MTLSFQLSRTGGGLTVYLDIVKEVLKLSSKETQGNESFNLRSKILSIIMNHKNGNILDQ